MIEGEIMNRQRGYILVIEGVSATTELVRSGVGILGKEFDDHARNLLRAFTIKVHPLHMFE